MRIKDYFSFTKAELRGIVILLLLIGGVLGYKYYLVEKNNKEILISRNKFEKDIKEFETTLEKQTNTKKTKFTANKQVKQSYKPYKKNIAYKKSKKQQAKKENVKAVQKLHININTATAAELKKLRGIGDKLSERIVKYRDRLGGFYGINQLKEVYGIKPEVFEKIRTQIYCEGSVRKINVNTATFKDLVHHPYLNYDEVKLIFQSRKKYGKLNKEILNFILGQDKTAKLLPYVEF